jgi:transcriptional adapter 2-alpha
MKRDRPESPYMPEDDIEQMKRQLVDYPHILGVQLCTACNKPVTYSPTFLCNDCGNVPFCIACFLLGTKTHRAEHSYYVLDRLKFPLYSPNWTAKEEVHLMKCIEMFGVDNWPQIADTIETKTADECEAHYYTFYYKSAQDKVPRDTDLIAKKSDNKVLIATDKEQNAKKKEEHYLKTKPEIFNDEEVKREEVKNPPKYGIDIPGADAILGYMPLRGDFNIEYDNDAEKMLSDIEFFEEDDPNEIRIKENVLRLYNTRLDERIRRKEFIIKHGLLEYKKPLKGETEKTKEEKEMYTLMRPFMRFCEGNEFNELVEGLIKERALRRELDEMRLYRSLGLTHLEQIDQYLERKTTRGSETSLAPKKVGRKKTKSSTKEGPST